MGARSGAWTGAVRPPQKAPKRTPAMSHAATDRTPALKLGLAILIGFALTIPLFMVWLMVYDREQESRQAQTGIAQGWGGPQTVSGPLLVIPYRATVTESVTENGKAV